MRITHECISGVVVAATFVTTLLVVMTAVGAYQQFQQTPDNDVLNGRAIVEVFDAVYRAGVTWAALGILHAVGHIAFKKD